MSANATGTPTANFSIPKFNTASDAPNGKGTNEMMDAIDALLASTFVRPKITTGTLGAGPPGSPAAGDIWIAQNVDGNGTSWMFTYNPAETTYKWEFIGGSPVVFNWSGSALGAMSTYPQIGVTGWFYNNLQMFTAIRGGDYTLQGSVSFIPNGFLAVCSVAAVDITTGFITFGQGAYVDSTSNVETTPWGPFTMTGVGAGNQIGLGFSSNANTATKFDDVGWAVLPRRIA